MEAYRTNEGRYVFARAARSEADVTGLAVLPCGQCIGCRKEKARQWAVRIMHEAQMHPSSCFVTLTYDDEHRRDDHELSKRDLQLFWKRLRKQLGVRIKYFACGEYGERSGREHYHAIIFGTAFEGDRKLWRKKHGKREPLWSSPTLSKAWKNGLALFGEVTFASAGYVAAYTLKKQTGPESEWIFGGTFTYDTSESGTAHCGYRPKQRPFILMSRGSAEDPGGIGASWYRKFGETVWHRDSVVMNGREQAVPEYYGRLLEKEDPERFKSIKRARKLRARKSDRLAENRRDDHAVAMLRTFKRDQV